MKRVLFLVVMTAWAIPGCETRPHARDAFGHARVAPPMVHARAIIVIRHADIDVAQKAVMGPATPLLPRGQARATELVMALKDAGVTRVVTSDSLRTQQTAAPLAKALGLIPESPFSHGPVAAGVAPGTRPAAGAGSVMEEAEKVYGYLAETGKAGETILVVNHHSILPSLMKQFGVEEGEIADATEFDRVYVILPVEDGGYRVMRLRYGGEWGR